MDNQGRTSGLKEINAAQAAAGPTMKVSYAADGRLLNARANPRSLAWPRLPFMSLHDNSMGPMTSQICPRTKGIPKGERNGWRHCEVSLALGVKKFMDSLVT